MKTALVIVDIQRDFCPGGALAVDGANLVVEPANQLVRFFESRGWPVFFTRDWHPENHCSFHEYGGPWPPHCIAGTSGAYFHPNLHVPAAATLVPKATGTDKDAYSGFEGTDLREQLDQLDVEMLVVAGLATDYCVKSTVLDALKAGYQVSVAADAIRAVNAAPDDGDRAIRNMQVRGAHFASTEELINRLSQQRQSLI